MRRRLWVFLVVLCVVVVEGAAPAEAHTEFEQSDPSDGTTVSEPINLITVTFTKSVTLIGSGFEVLLPEGQIVEPTVTSDDGGLVWKLELAEPAGSGNVAVRYNVAADDGHPLSGGFTFVVDAPEATSTTLPTTSSTVAPTTLAEPSTTEPSTSEPSTSGVVAAEPESAAASGATANDASGTERSLGLVVAAGLALAIAGGGFLFSRRQT